MSKQEPQSYEVAPYSDVDFGVKEAHQVIIQTFRDIVRDSPAHAVWGDIVGDQLRIRYHTYTMHLPVRIKQIEEEADSIFKETVKHLKKEFKARTGKDLKLKEAKDLAGDGKERVSLNERYYYKAWRFYDISF